MVALLCVAPRAEATVMVEVALEDMVRDSVAIVRGRVVHVGSQVVMNGDSLDPHTLATVQVTDWIKGEGGQTLTVRELGGTYGPNGQAGGMWIDGTPRYQVGEEVIVFLERDPNDPHYFRTYAMAQGKFVVTQGVGGAPATVSRDAASVGFARWLDGRMTIESGGHEVMPLDTFLATIRGVTQVYAPGHDDVLGGSR
ncbi:MAG: hypothetical protein CMN31_24490 [Sandaracinus sp.]|nr:hypothetical protein [Sandaracinus sp.]